MDVTLTNARIVGLDGISAGSITCKKGLISAVEPNASRPGIDMDNDLLIPGLVDLHANCLIPKTSRERHFDPILALAEFDKVMIESGVSTSVATINIEDRSGAERAGELLQAIESSTSNNLLRSSVSIHLRCETPCPALIDYVLPLLDNRFVALVSYMDHTPGQRQFADLDACRQYLMAENAFSEHEADAFIADRRELSERHARANRTALAALCAKNGLVLASHDDASEVDIEEAERLGVRIIEFPTTLDAACTAQRKALGVVLSSSNLMRGQSRYGNLATIAAIKYGIVPALASDNAPTTLLKSVFYLNSMHGISLPRAVAMVSELPASLANFLDRGKLIVGQRADIVRVNALDGAPSIRGMWVRGHKVI